MVTQLQGQLIEQPTKPLCDRLTWVTYRNVPILYFDFSGCSEREILVVSQRGARLLRDNGLSKVLALINASHLPKSKKAANFSQKFAQELEPFISRSAVYGLNSRSHFLFRLVGAFTGTSFHLFENRDEALDALLDRKG